MRCGGVRVTSCVVLVTHILFLRRCTKHVIFHRMGLDHQVLLDVLNNSSARSWSTEVYCPVPGLVSTAPSSNNYDGGFKNELMVKVCFYYILQIFLLVVRLDNLKDIDVIVLLTWALVVFDMACLTPRQPTC